MQYLCIDKTSEMTSCIQRKGLTGVWKKFKKRTDLQVFSCVDAPRILALGCEIIPWGINNDNTQKLVCFPYICIQY